MDESKVKRADVCGSAENSVSAKSSSQVKERRQVEWIGMQESEPVSARAPWIKFKAIRPPAFGTNVCTVRKGLCILELSAKLFYFRFLKAFKMQDNRSIRSIDYCWVFCQSNELWACRLGFPLVIISLKFSFKFQVLIIAYSIARV